MDFHVSLWNQLVGIGGQHGIVEKDSGLHKVRQVWVWVQILSLPLTNYDFGRPLPFVVFFSIFIMRLILHRVLCICIFELSKIIMQNMCTQQTPVSFSHSGTQETKLVLGEAQNNNFRDRRIQGREGCCAQVWSMKTYKQIQSKLMS